MTSIFVQLLDSSESHIFLHKILLRVTLKFPNISKTKLAARVSVYRSRFIECITISESADTKIRVFEVRKHYMSHSKKNFFEVYVGSTWKLRKQLNIRILTLTITLTVSRHDYIRIIFTWAVVTLIQLKMCQENF